jgi:hypothetical protein
MYLYHVTYIRNLPSIQVEGLRPGSGQTFQGTWYAGYSQGWLFLTSGDGVRYWMHKLEEHALANTDNPEEGWTPVVLSFSTGDVELELEDDPEGTRDALATSWKTRGFVPADELVVWDGEDWTDLEDVDPDDMNETALEAGEFVEEDGEGWWELDADVFLPPDDELGDEEEEGD